METLDKQKLLTWLEKQSKNNALSQAFYAFEVVIKGVKEGAFDATDCLSKEAIQEIINTADVIDKRNQELIEQVEELEWANNEWKASDKLWKETVENLIGENSELLASEAVTFNNNNKVRGDNKKLVNALEKQRKALEWAARIIDSVMYSAEPPRYDPHKWFAEYHELMKEDKG